MNGAYSKAYFGLIMSFLVLFSCGKESALFNDSLSLQDAEQRYSANPEIQQFINLARNVVRFSQEHYGVSFDEKNLRFLPGAADSLAWRLIALPRESLQPAVDMLYYDSKTLEARKVKAEASGLKVYSSGENPLLVADKPAPLLESWARWPYDRQVERVFQILFYQYSMKTLKRTDAEPLSRFLAERATEEYLLANLGGASPVLARYISEQRDEKTFATLFPDFAERVYNLYQHKDPAASAETIEASRTQLLKLWIAEHKRRYTERFLTNRYADFGNTIPQDGEILFWQHQLETLGNWKQYQGEYRRAGESVKTYLQALR